jgi:hypothetical protein
LPILRHLTPPESRRSGNSQIPQLPM